MRSKWPLYLIVIASVISSLLFIKVTHDKDVYINSLLHDKASLMDEVVTSETEIVKLMQELVETRAALVEAQEVITKLKGKVTIESMTNRGQWQPYKATFYSAGVASTGKSPEHPTYGLTASGHRVQEGLTASTDPNVIPTGSWFMVKFEDGTIETFRADDRGSGVKGNHVDIYLPSHEQAIKNGVIPVQVRIIE